MKWILFVGFALAASFSHAEDQRIEVKPESFLAPINGYLDTDNVQGVTYGILPSDCYKIADAQVERTGPSSFVVHQYAVQTCEPSADSPKAIYTVNVNFGMLPAGTYTVNMITADGKNDVHSIAVGQNRSISTAGRYAGIHEAAMKSVLNPGEHLIVQYTGTLNNGCTFVDPNLQINHTDHTYLISPTFHRKPGMCAEVIIPFQRNVDLGAQQPGYYLIHVRTISGQSVQQVVEAK